MLLTHKKKQNFNIKNFFMADSVYQEQNVNISSNSSGKDSGDILSFVSTMIT